MSTTRRYTAISFDVGYTLLEPYREASAIVVDMLREQQIEVEPAALMAAHQRAERLFLEDYLRPLGDTWTADARIRAFYLRYYTQFLADLGIADTDRTHSAAIIDRYLDPTNWRLYPHVLETLARLHENGYRLGVASDWGSGLTRILHGLGLSRYLDWAVVSGAIGFAKPSAQFYRLVVQRSGVPTQQIVHVGDSYYADVRGARTVGMDALLIDYHRRWSGLDVPILHDLAELPDLLNNLALPMDTRS